MSRHAGADSVLEFARIARNWIEADRLRDAIALKGYTVEDTATGPKVSKASA